MGVSPPSGLAGAMRLRVADATPPAPENGLTSTFQETRGSGSWGTTSPEASRGTTPRICHAWRRYA